MSSEASNQLRWTVALSLALLLATDVTARAQNSAILVRDLDTGQDAGVSSEASGFMVVGDTVYFTADDYVHGRELWRTDGTVSGTRLVKDFGTRSSGVIPFTAFRDRLVFLADDGAHGRELWITDGTDAGTSMIRDLTPGPDSSYTQSPVVVGDTLFFIDGQRLWRTDGSPQGTSEVATAPRDYSHFAGLCPLSNTELAIVVGVDYDPEVWSSDGTTAGTKPVASLGVPASDPNHVECVPVGDKAFMVVDDGTYTPSLIVTDGTAVGTTYLRRLSTIDVHVDPSGGQRVMTIGDQVLFIAEDDSTGPELWRSDGTHERTSRVLDIRPGPDGSLPHPRYDGNGLYPLFSAIGDTLFFVANDGVHGLELWRSDATAAGTSMVRDINPGPPPIFEDSCHSCREKPFLAQARGMLIFPADDGVRGVELWRSDGTPGGTSLLKEINAGALGSYPSRALEAGGLVFFIADDGIHGRELWRTDGTESGTILLADIVAGPATSDPALRVPLLDRVVFLANNGEGTEPWISDGTPEGTFRLRDIADIERSSNPASLTRLGSTLFFAAQTRNDGQLWRSDGTQGGTTLVRGRFDPVWFGGPRLLTAVGPRLFFTAGDEIHANELWSSDGTSGGTHLVADLIPGRESSHPYNLIGLGESLFFTAYDRYGEGRLWRSDGTDAAPIAVVYVAGDTITRVGGQLFFGAFSGVGGELWRSDGTTQGTRLVRDIAPGADFSQPSNIVAFGRRAFFAAHDGLHGREIWSSDGTEDGTALLMDIAPGMDSSVSCRGSVFQDPELVVSGARVFFTASDGVHGRELWATDGTAHGTHLVYNIAPDAGDGFDCDFSGNPIGGYLTDLHGRVLFAASATPGDVELWRSDGSEGGTIRVRDINPGHDGSRPADLIQAGGLLVFSADDGAHGRELWVSDGTEAGTRLAHDINPGPASSEPTEFTQVDGELYFSASDGVHGRELWQLPFAALVNPCACDCNADGRVVVSELITAVNAALGNGTVQCNAADADLNGSVDVNDLVAGVSIAVGVCQPTVRPESL